MSYQAIKNRIDNEELVILDGAIGTELERRGVPMDHESWSAPASLEHADVLEAIHLDYIRAGARVVTANTFSTSRLMLEAAGYGDRVEEVNRASVEAAQRARARSGCADVAVAGSISHWTEGQPGKPQPSDQQLADVFGELAVILKDSGADLILLEMMYIPERIEIARKAAVDTGLPVWMGFSARAGDDGEILSFRDGVDMPFIELVQSTNTEGVHAMGAMHTSSHLVSGALATIHDHFDGPTYAYPDSGYFEMPNWKFEDVIPPSELGKFASQWEDEGVAAVGGCCGLSTEHIKAVRDRCLSQTS